MKDRHEETYRDLSWNFRELPRYVLAPWIAAWCLAAVAGWLAGASLDGDWLPLVGIVSSPFVVSVIVLTALRCRVGFSSSGVTVYNLVRRTHIDWSRFRRLEYDVRPWVSGGVIVIVHAAVGAKEEEKTPLLAVSAYMNNDFVERLERWLPAT